MREEAKKLLITGASGFLGWNLCLVAKPEWDVYGTFFSHSHQIPGITQISVDLRDFQAIKDLFNDIKPDAVIHTAAASQPNYCQNYPQESQEINVAATVNLAGLCGDYSLPFAFTSTDLVFDGLNPPYRETDPTCPISVYGEQKVMAEIGILERYPLAAVCRMPLMFGDGGLVAKSFLQPMLESIRVGKELHLFVDEFRTPVSGKTAAQGLLLALKEAHGIIHLGGKERISRYDFMRLVVEVLKLKNTNLVPCKQKDIQMLAPRPPDVSLDISKAIALGYKPLSLKSELEQLKDLLWHQNLSSDPN